MARERQWRVLVVDDHATFRETVRYVLTRDTRFEIAAEAASGEEAVSLARQVEPNLVLMDMRLPGINGLAAAAAILAAQPHTIVLILSGDWSPAYERKAQAVGVKARLAKQAFSLSELERVLAQSP